MASWPKREAYINIYVQEKDISIVHLVLSQNAKKDSCGERLQFQADYFMSFCHRILKRDYVNFEKK